MTIRDASCACGALSIETRGEPVKISACHCKACQKRTGSAFGVAVFFDKDQTTTSGPSGCYRRPGDSGDFVVFHFCLACGSTVFWLAGFRPGRVAVAIGAFEDRTLRPTQAVYEEDRRAWVAIALQAPDAPN